MFREKFGYTPPTPGAQTSINTGENDYDLRSDRVNCGSGVMCDLARRVRVRVRGF